MLCDKCKKNEATLLISHNINGEKSVFNFCYECAAAHTPDISFDTILKNFMNSLMGATASVPPNAANSAGGPNHVSPAIPEASTCPSCGLTHEGLKKTGRVGCVDCYATFRRHLETLFKNVHGSTRHSGKTPNRQNDAVLRTRELIDLRLRLRELVECEEFEEAAKVRDRIKELYSDE